MEEFLLNLNSVKQFKPFCFKICSQFVSCLTNCTVVLIEKLTVIKDESTIISKLFLIFILFILDFSNLYKSKSHI